MRAKLLFLCAGMAACAPDAAVEAEGGEDPIESVAAHGEMIEPEPNVEARVYSEPSEVPADILANAEQDTLQATSNSKALIGRDDRKPVPDTRVAPYASIVALFPTFPKQADPELCSGVLIANDAVLTAAHCIYKADLGGYAVTTRVVPASYSKDGITPLAPFGASYGVRARVTDDYKRASTAWDSYATDYGVIRLKHPLGKTAGVRTIEVARGDLMGRAVTLAGYHEDKYGGPATAPWPASALFMQESTDRVRKVYNGTINHYADSKPGSSGSPLVFAGAKNGAVSAVHIAGPEAANGQPFNIGVLIDDAKLATVRAWLAE